MKKYAIVVLVMLALRVNGGVNDSKSWNFKQWGSPRIIKGNTYFYKSDGYKIVAHYKKCNADWVTYSKKGMKPQEILAKLSRLGKWVAIDSLTYVIYNSHMRVSYRGTYYNGSFTVKFIGGRRW